MKSKSTGKLLKSDLTIIEDKFSWKSTNYTTSRTFRCTFYLTLFLLFVSAFFLLESFIGILQGLSCLKNRSVIIINLKPDESDIDFKDENLSDNEFDQIIKETFFENQPDNQLTKPDFDTRLRESFNLFYSSKISVGKPNFKLSSSPEDPQCSSVKLEERFDCNPDQPINEKVCTSRGCCWKPAEDPAVGVPYCYYPNDYEGYKLKYIRGGKNELNIRLKRNTPSGFPSDIANVQVYVSGLDDERVRIRIFDPEHARYEVTLPFFNISQNAIKAPLYSIVLEEKGFLQIVRKTTGIVVFQTDLRRLVFANQFIQLSNLVPSKFLYGIGEHFDSFRKEITWKKYTLFNRDSAPIPNMNLYGSWAFYLMTEDESNGNSHGVYLLNSNAMDIILQPTPAVTYRTVGGILDFFIYMGPTAKNVVQQNSNLLGRPVMQPYWALGFHLCKYGYGSLNKTKETMQRNLDAGIPLDAQWNDIDYMDRYNDFTYDLKNFHGLPEFVDELHGKGMHYMCILDPGVSAGEKPGTYPPYDEGVKGKLLIMNSTGDVFVGKVWNLKSTAFPDFVSKRSWPYWTKMFEDYYSKVKIDGAWIDMNEPSNFYDGTIKGCPKDDLENPPYTPGNSPLRTKTVCMSAKHELGNHYDLHNLLGIYETFATYQALTKIRKKRPLIVSRSSFPGIGHYGSHWSGDVYSDWDGLKYSISNMLEFNLYGVPMIGSDICGFNSNTTVELCMRWSAVGAFYPFSRNHNSDDTIEQDPVAMGPKVVAAAKYALNMRYTLLPYLYYLFYKAHVYGDSVARPLFFEFSSDPQVYSIESQFMWGSNIMFVPILDPGVNEVKAYFPESKWFDYQTLQLFIDSEGEYQNVQIDDDKIGIFIRGGTITPVGSKARNTVEQRKQSLQLLAAPDSRGQCKGEFFNDDGESLETIESGNYTLCHCQSDMARLTCSGPKCDMSNFESITILNAKPVSNITLNGYSIQTYTYGEKTKILSIKIPKLMLRKSIDVTIN